MSSAGEGHNESYGLFFRADFAVCPVASNPLFKFRSFVLSFVRSFVRSHVLILVPSFIYPFIRSFIRSFLCSFIILCVRSFVGSVIPPFFRSFVFSSVILCAPRFVYFCGISFLNQIYCLFTFPFNKQFP